MSKRPRAKDKTLVVGGVKIWTKWQPHFENFRSKPDAPDKFLADCRLCKRTGIAYTNSSAFNLSRHFEETCPAKRSLTSRTLEDHGFHRLSAECRTRAWGKWSVWVATRGISHEATQCPLLLDFIRDLSPQMTLPSRRTLGRIIHRQASGVYDE